MQYWTYGLIQKDTSKNTINGILYKVPEMYVIKNYKDFRYNAFFIKKLYR